MAKIVRLQWRQFNRGWFPAGTPDNAPPGTLRRALGIGDFRTPEVRTRNGGQDYVTVPGNAHSIIRFRGLGIMSGVGGNFYQELTLIKAGLNGNRLTFLKMPTFPGQADSLYVAGGGTLFKVSGSGVVTNWGVAAPGSAPTLTASPIATVTVATSDAVALPVTSGVIIQVTSYTDAVGDTVTITINGTPHVLTEGVHWGANTSNNTTALNISNAINTLTGVTATTAGSAGDAVTVTAVGTGALTGTYQYAYTFHNDTDEVESDPSPIASITVAAQDVTLSGLLVSSDPQVTHLGIYRTTADGDTLLNITYILNGVTSYVDSTADEDLTLSVLATDRAIPSGAWARVAGPWAGRGWIAGSTTDGEKGRVYYTSAGHPDGIAGFIAVTNDDDPTQMPVVWGGSLYVFSRRGLFQVFGDDEPFAYREVYGVVGTTKPHTVIATPYGICYQAYDGVRIFDGTRSRLIGWDAIAPTFRAETLLGGLTGADVGGVPPFQGIVGAFYRDEYHISDTIDTWLAISLRDEAWRIIVQRDASRHPALSFYFDDVAGSLFSGNITSAFLSNDLFTTDGAISIKFDVETPHWSPSTGGLFTVRRFLVDLYTTNQSVTPSLVVDGTVYDYPVVAAAGRQVFDYPAGRGGHEFGFRLRGEVSEWTILYQVEAEILVYGETGG